LAEKVVHAATEIASKFYAEAQKHPAGSPEHKQAMAQHHWHASKSAFAAGDHEIAKHHAQQSAEHSK
jgi:hypothetical protein